MNETFAASAAKVAAVNTGAAISMATNPNSISAIAGILAATYSVIQIIKALPWMTDYAIAIKTGIFRRDWSHWRSIAKRTEKETNDNPES